MNKLAICVLLLVVQTCSVQIQAREDAEYSSIFTPITKLNNPVTGSAGSLRDTPQKSFSLL